MYVWAAKSEEECREWVIHEEFSLTVKVSPLIESEKELFEDRVTTALPRIAKLITALSGDGGSLSAEQKALRERIAQFYGLSGSGDMLFGFLQSTLLPVIQAIDAELKSAMEDSSKVFRASASGAVGGYNIVNRNVYLTEDFFKTSPKEQALTIAHEYAHKVGMNHKVGFSASLVEGDRLKVVYMCSSTDLETLITWNLFTKGLFLTKDDCSIIDINGEEKRQFNHSNGIELKVTREQVAQLSELSGQLVTIKGDYFSWHNMISMESSFKSGVMQVKEMAAGNQRFQGAFGQVKRKD